MTAINANKPVALTPTIDAATASLKGIAEQKDMFLKLLVAQLKNQDPSAPMDQKDMMAQMAQMTSVEQMTNMVKAMDTMSFNATFSQSVNMIGQSVKYTAVNNTIATGRVASVRTGAGEISLLLEDGTRIKTTDVVEVAA